LTIEEDFSFWTGALSIRGSHLALLYKVDELYDVRIIIFDWVLVNGCSTAEPSHSRLAERYANFIPSLCYGSLIF